MLRYAFPVVAFAAFVITQSGLALLVLLASVLIAGLQAAAAAAGPVGRDGIGFGPRRPARRQRRAALA
jgi:hypothetical protein